MTYWYILLAIGVMAVIFWVVESWFIYRTLEAWDRQDKTFERMNR